MKLFALTSGSFRGLVALSVSLAVIGSNQAFAFAFFSNSNSPQPAQLQSDGGFESADAFVADGGVRLEWSSKSDPDNLGFNIYRLQGGQRVRINREIIPGSVFAGMANDARLSRGNASYGWFDHRGTAAAVYYIESVSLAGASQFYPPVTPVAETRPPGRKQPPRYQEAQPQTSEIDPEASDNGYREVGYPATDSAAVLRQELRQMSVSTIESQWDVAAQPGVKIAVKRDGWYRVTQAQMAAVGFNPAVDIRNLQLFVDGQEVAINTSQSGGLFGASDYIEFFGRGLDVPSTDVRTYYLLAGAAPGKRVRGELQIDALPAATPTPQALPTPSPANGPVPKSPWSPWRWGGRVANAAQTALPHTFSLWEREGRGFYGHPKALPLFPLPTGKGMKEMSAGNAPETSPVAPKKKRGKKRVRRKPAEPKRQFSHAVVSAAAVAPANFAYTVERKDRGVYFSSLLNGDVENWFGQVISTNPASQTINTPNPALNAAGPARLEVRLQGVNQVSHQVSVKVNDVQVGAFNFFGLANAVQVFNVPLSLLKDGALANNANTIKFTPAAGGDVSIVDYARITYPHAFRADADTLKFSLLGTQSVQVDGFTSANVRLIDYTDPANVTFVKPELTSNGGGGYTMAVPTSAPISKTQRLLYATATPAETPAAITLNQPSTLNRNTNAADFLIITTNSLRASLAPLVTARQAQGMTVAVVEVDDVYDEFAYGVHGPQAVKDFLARANSVWATKPKYVIFAGDASYDPRNYASGGNFDLVPTKLVDATYNETASDDWLADFNDDGIADIPVGRLPLRTPAEVDLVVSKIVNFTPVAPESAMLVADDPTGYYFNFEQANDQVQAQLPPSVTVQRVNVRVDGVTPAKANVINGFNAGRALVNYTGHGNVDVWSGAAIFKATDAIALTNGNKLSFVIVMDCLNGYYHAPALLSLSEAFLKAPGGGAVAAFASSGLTLPDGQHDMSTQLYSLLYGAQPIALGDAIKIAKGATVDIDVRRTWIFFGDPSMKIR